jgi:hypothetical protein
MVSDQLDGDATETFSFRMSKGLRHQLRVAAANQRRTVGREIVLRLIASFEDAAVEDPSDVVASSVAKEALSKATMSETKIAELEKRVSRLEQGF